MEKSKKIILQTDTIKHWHLQRGSKYKNTYIDKDEAAAGANIIRYFDPEPPKMLCGSINLKRENSYYNSYKSLTLKTVYNVQPEIH